MENEGRSLKDICCMAIRIQDASNIIAVTGELRQAMIDVRKHGLNERTYPAIILLNDKIQDMLGRPYGWSNAMDVFSDAYEECKKVAGIDE